MGIFDLFKPNDEDVKRPLHYSHAGNKIILHPCPNPTCFEIEPDLDINVRISRPDRYISYYGIVCNHCGFSVRGSSYNEDLDYCLRNWFETTSMLQEKTDEEIIEEIKAGTFGNKVKLDMKGYEFRQTVNHWKEFGNP